MFLLTVLNVCYPLSKLLGQRTGLLPRLQGQINVSILPAYLFDWRDHDSGTRAKSLEDLALSRPLDYFLDAKITLGDGPLITVKLASREPAIELSLW